MKTHFYILLMLGMVFLLGCEDEKLGTDLGVTNVVLPDISEESLGTEITIQGNGFIDCDVLALSPLSGGTEQPIYMETQSFQFSNDFPKTFFIKYCMDRAPAFLC